MRRHRPICGGRESLELGCQQSRIGRGCREIHVSWQEKGRFTADVRRLANLTILFINIQVHTVEIERTHFILSATDSAQQGCLSCNGCTPSGESRWRSDQPIQSHSLWSHRRSRIYSWITTRNSFADSREGPLDNEPLAMTQFRSHRV